MENIEIELTDEEEKATHYCQDFCPIYQGITDYNTGLKRKHKIYCTPNMCKRIVNTYVLNMRENNI